ncbi:Bacteriophytochrome (light-regulated signal transduction histidine kinase) [Dyadobacter koreensis]|uniref:histidine kinase n=1 Tax=Dyadobacter koreensis TaxID=408657 RepID=A0A1H6T7H2_9BACT|nr:ATP-binding protein [Dyadobacter koreensis]SEI75216.1 Bacteriophytochrome (light-regulated signal transduction histidine kinase) [Dyadobacter koreensis]
MNITDIVNRDIVNLTNCESEPIHIPGSIQPHGFLLGLKADDHLIDFCSANAEKFLELSPEKLLGKSLTEIFSEIQYDNFVTYLSEDKSNQARPFVFTFENIPYNTSVNISGVNIILELEPFPDGTLDLPNLYNQTRNFVSLMEQHSSLLELCNDIAVETRRITGYDRVMIYRFDEEYNGEVVAENKREDLVSFARQKYPHTDIPAQARELYLRSPLRMIADVYYEPVPLLTLNESGNKSNKSLDLSLSGLRSVSPIHIEYLKNMGVGATLTISLLQNNKLWGLIACHHYSPKILPHYTRLAALLQGHFLTSQISVREVAEEFQIAQASDKALLESLTLLHENENFIGEKHTSKSLLSLANAHGFVIYTQGKFYKNGLVPSDGELTPLMRALSEKYPNTGFHTEQLIEDFPEYERLSKYAAGVIYHSLAAGTPDGVLWMRAERPETINWAGNPHKAVVHKDGKDGLARLSPRKSFELWLEEVKNKSAKWRKAELNSSASFTYALQKHINLHYVRAQENKNRILNEELKAANKELANLNWISTHDLKEPLRKIQIFASKVLDRENPDLSTQVKDSVERMRFAAEKMQLLIEDILTYSKTGNMEKVFEETDLNELLKKVLAELCDNVDEKNALIAASPLPALKVIPFQIHQLFVNLITNALKFSKHDVAPMITIGVDVVREDQVPSDKAHKFESYYSISFVDNGIGFEKEYEQRIFDVFQRLHPAHKYPGTGIGLAICKKIMENHAGYIVADSELGQGSRFTLFFPITDDNF